MIGHQMLYTAPTHLKTSEPVASHLLCTRYDVDGVLWAPAPHDSKRPWAHVATLQAFGYVLASKQSRRFVASPPLDLATAAALPFVAVADINRHVYVYWQPSPNPLTELRHRRGGNSGSEGSDVVHIAWQQLISLPENDEIIGFAAVAVDEPYAACVVATRRALFLICLDED